MKYNVYAIRDIKTGYLQPTVDLNDESAKRNFEHAVNNSNSLFFSHASDYSLYRIATYDTELGIIQPVEKELLLEASDVVLAFKKGDN